LIWTLRLLAGRRQPKAAAKPHTHCISKKAAPRRPPSKALPQQSRTVHGAQRSAPRRGKDRSFLKYNSNGTVNAPPIKKWGVFEEETEGTFRRKIQAALF